MRRYNQGWKSESERHSLARRGVKTKTNFDRMPWWRKWASTDYFRQQMQEMNEDTQAGMRQSLAEERKAKREKLKHHALAAKTLPVYKIGGKLYFRDERLGEYRNVMDFNDSMRIDSVPLSKLQRPTKADSEKVFGKSLAAKGTVTEEELDYVRNWFKTHKNKTYDYSDNKINGLIRKYNDKSFIVKPRFLRRGKIQEESVVPFWYEGHNIIVSVVGSQGDTRMRITTPTGSRELGMVGADFGKIKTDKRYREVFKRSAERQLKEMGYEVKLK